MLREFAFSACTASEEVREETLREVREVVEARGLRDRINFGTRADVSYRRLSIGGYMYVTSIKFGKTDLNF